MSNYYDKREAKVKIAEELMRRGWKVYGYHEDRSDSMTDYYDPACWLDGIAEKNGFILVVDNDYDAEPKEIKKYNPKGNLSPEDRDKIEKLSKMTQINGATEGEEQNAKALMEKLQAKVSNEPSYIITGTIPGHMANPGKCIWHIEKNGKIYDKGTGIVKFNKVPETWEFNINTMEYTDSYKYYRDWEYINGEYQQVRKERKLSEEEEKAINSFKQFILRLERVVNGLTSCGDGTAETEKEGLVQQQKEGYEKVVVKETKKVIKPVQKDNNEICLNDVLSFSYHGHYWMVINIYKNNKDQTCIVYELLGSEKRGYQKIKNGKRYYQPEARLQKEITEGKVKVYTLQEVTEVIEVEKWVKISNNKKVNNSKLKTEQKEQVNQQETKEQPTQKQTTDNILGYEITITADIDTRDNSPLWVVKIINSLTKEEYKKVAEQIKELKGYYSKFKHGFIFKYDPSEVLKGEQQEQEQQTETTEPEKSNPYDSEKIEEGYIYNCHFKEWKFNINQLQDIVEQYNLPWIDMDNKIGFECLTPEQTTLAKTISDSNESIFFIDAKIKITDIEQTEEDAEQQAENLLDISTSIITEMNISFSDIEFNQETKKEYIKKLTTKIKDYKIPITANMVKYLLNNNFENFVGVLALVSISTEQKEQQKQEDQSYFIERIEKAIESNNGKIEKLSGDYLTNTPKRAREQASRDNQKEQLQNDNLLLEYLKEKAENNSMTELEKAITINTIREEIKYYYLQKYQYKNNIEYPRINNSYPSDGWWNIEVPKRQKRLNKANIFNTQQLLTVIEEYKSIITTIEQPKNPITEQIKKKERELKFCKIPGYFPTPKNIVNQMIELADLKENDVILEPSAGNGNIADSITELGHKVDVIEWNYSLQELLKLKNHNLITDDFLSYSNYNRYNKILMNPPFEHNSDIKHVLHAYKMLKNNGRIVAIMSPHFTFASEKESIDFREWLNNRGYYKKLPEGSFKDSGTNVNTVLVVIDKLEGDMSQAG